MIPCITKKERKKERKKESHKIYHQVFLPTTQTFLIKKAIDIYMRAAQKYLEPILDKTL